MLVPITTLKSAILQFHKELALYPLWICPMRLLSPPSDKMAKQLPANVDRPAVPKLKSGEVNEEEHYPLSCPIPGGMVNPTPSEQLYVDIGAYGVPQAKQWKDIVMKIYGRVKNVIDTDQEENLMPMDDSVDAQEEFHIRVMRRVIKEFSSI
jgi:hypothetical protein